MLLRWIIAWVLTVAPVLAGGIALTSELEGEATHASCCCIDPEQAAVDACCALTASGEPTGESRCDSDGCQTCQSCVSCCPTTGKPVVFMTRVTPEPADAQDEGLTRPSPWGSGIGLPAPTPPPPKGWIARFSSPPAHG